MTRIVLVGTLCCAMSGAVANSAAWADDAAAAELYGQGIHAFFAGDYDEAQRQLSAAVEAGTSDPRCYYFRGLSLLRLGREEQAQADFAKGGELECADVDHSYPVSRSMERVQGRTRLVVEKYRAKARLEAIARKKAEETIRYERLQAAEEEVVRRRPVQGATTQTPPEKAPETATTGDVKPPVPGVVNPFGAGADKGGADKGTEPETDKPPVEKPTDPPVEKPVEKPADPPVEKPAEPPIEKPIEKPADSGPTPKIGLGVLKGVLQRALGKALGGDEKPGQVAPPFPGGIPQIDGEIEIKPIPEKVPPIPDLPPDKGAPPTEKPPTGKTDDGKIKSPF